MIRVRNAYEVDIPLIMKFIREHWKEGYILGEDEEFFRWMYVRNGEVNFNIAVDDVTNQLYGINGYIIYNEEPFPDVTGTLWKVIKSGNPALGLSMGEYARKRWKVNYMLSVGMSQKAVRIAKLHKADLASMEHWYMLGNVREYRVAKIYDCPPKWTSGKTGRFKKIGDIDAFAKAIPDEVLRRNIPYKNHAYVKYRYFAHPIYDYQFYEVLAEGDLRGVFVLRELECRGARIGKIVDFYGADEVVAGSGGLWEHLLQERQYEYIDFYCYGIAKEYLRDAGFSLLTNESRNIIPNYFEPFEQTNVDIKITTILLPGFHMYRGDGDQDRPSFPRVKSN